jgi:hypothetical protein
MSLLLYFSWTVNTCYDVWARGSRFTSDVYRLWKNEGLWMITDDGLFGNTNDFSFDSNVVGWVYRDGVLSKTGTINTIKKGPFLSCMFKYGNETVEMDEFLENTRMAIGCPFPVLMAAFCIYSKKVYPWRTAAFEVFLNSGESANFTGSSDAVPGFTNNG